MQENKTASARLLLAKQGYSISPPKKNVRLDSWVNKNTGFGEQHATRKTNFYKSRKISQGELEALYSDDWVVGNGIEIPARYMTGKGISFLHNNDDDENIDKINDFSELITNDYQALRFAYQAIIYSRLYGGNATFFNYGGSTFEQRNPIRDEEKKDIKWIKNFGACHAIPVSWYTEFDNPKYGKPEHYQLIFREGNQGQVIYAHESRILVMQGRFSTQLNIQLNRGWYDSYVQRAYDAIQDFQSATSSASATLEDFVYKTLGVKDLASAVMNNDDDYIVERVKMAANKLQIGNVGLYDSEGETMEKHGTPITGFDSLWDRFGDIICGVWRIPRSILLSAETGNLGGSTSEADRSNFFDDISNDQENYLRPWLNEFIKNVSMVNQVDYSDINFKFNPIRELTSLQKAEERNKQALTDEINIRSQVVSPEEVAVSRFSKPEPDLVTMKIDLNAREEMQKDAGQEEQNEFKKISDELK